MTEHENNDAALRALLRSAAPEPPIEEVDWDGLHARIAARAQPLLKQTPRRAWLHMLAHWSMPALPVTASAAAVLALLIAAGLIGPRQPDASAPAATGAASYVTVEEELTYAVTNDERAVLIAGADANELLDMVLFYEEVP